MTGDEYAAHFKRFQTFVRTFGDVRPFTIACGPNRNDVEWTRRFMSVVGPGAGRMRGVLPSGYAMHYYQNGRDTPTRFSVEALEEQLSLVTRMDEAIAVQRGLLDSYLQMPPAAQLPRGITPQRPQVRLIVDEWGVWDRMVPEEEKRFGRLWMQSTMRSAVIGAMGLNVFHRHADKLYMCNIAQTVNVLHSVLLAHEDRCIRTSSYYAFMLQKPHRGNMAVRAEAGGNSPSGLSVSASKKDNELVVTFVNPRHDTEMKVSCGLPGAAAVSARAQLLHHPDHNACNTFERPDVIVPRDHSASIDRGRLTVDLPAMSIVTANVRLSG
jgi:alpha-N-arabinofuranosidase